MNIIMSSRHCVWIVDGKPYQSYDDGQGVAVWEGNDPLYGPNNDDNERAPMVDPEIEKQIKTLITSTPICE